MTVHPRATKISTFLSYIHTLKMVTLVVSLKGKPKQTLSFPGDESKTTIKDVKAAVQAHFPQVYRVTFT